MQLWKALRRPRRLAAVALAAGAVLAGVRIAGGSDHQDTPLVELNPRLDMTDVYVFPGKTDPANRIVLVMNSSGFLSPPQTASAAFDPNVLYQFKVDNTGDGVEDKVIQVTFDGASVNQRVEVRGPIAPPVPGAMMNRIARTAPRVTGSLNQVLGSPSGMQVFAGPRDDPFYIDLEAIFCVLPDRKPVTGALAGPCALSLPPNSFRPAGQALNYTAGFNVLSIVIELPRQELEGPGPGRIGIWATMSR
ncbi:MAG TPA: DUF4331 family protein [Gemmatimonadales bacterium]|nr:DUF4331 family protein [Gemmatimonadales bacterium]